jgi:hypothetical protein
MSLCRLCGRNKPLVRAHIIPESMYPFEDVPRQPLLKVPSNPAAPLEKSRVGEYDSALVCKGCEEKFSPWDDYGSRLFRKEPKPKDRIYIDGGWRAYTLEAYDYAKLKLFFISLLWRASETERAFFEKVNVGPRHTARLKEMILNKNPGMPDEYAAWIMRLTHEIDAHKSVLSPYRRRYEQVWFYHFYLAGHVCIIKVDRRPAPSMFSRFILRPNEPLHVLIMRFNETREYAHLRRALLNLRLD